MRMMASQSSLGQIPARLDHLPAKRNRHPDLKALTAIFPILSAKNEGLTAELVNLTAKLNDLSAELSVFCLSATSSALSVSFQLYRSVLNLSRNQKKASRPVAGSWLRWYLIWHVPNDGAWQCY
ncbi:hypothetical protein [Cytobacillus firmus]|uniref:hypothetical protein n=1 Tax=Cytobacillus firmus TaxID=1399 RepID=UPI0022284965|nr:hypothetical protein [Cytobacillus firmus]